MICYSFSFFVSFRIHNEIPRSDFPALRTHYFSNLRFSDSPSYSSTYAGFCDSLFRPVICHACKSFAVQWTCFAFPVFVFQYLFPHRFAKYYAVFSKTSFPGTFFGVLLFPDSDRHVPCSALCHHVSQRALAPSCKVFAVCFSSERSFSCKKRITEKKSVSRIAKR